MTCGKTAWTQPRELAVERTEGPGDTPRTPSARRRATSAPRPACLALAVLLLPTGVGGTEGERPADPTDGETLPASAAEPGELFLQANSAYEAAEYGRAARLYEQVAAGTSDSGWVYYNLGNSYLRAGYLGKAIASYLRSEALLPREGDVQANLAFARKSTADAIEPQQSEAILRTLFFWHFGLSRKEALGLLAILNALLWTVLAVRLFRRQVELLGWAAGLLLVACLAVGGSVAVHLLHPTRVAVISQHEVNVHSGTSEDTVVRFKLHTGTETRVDDEDDGWVRIALPDGKQGWVREANVEIMTL